MPNFEKKDIDQILSVLEKSKEYDEEKLKESIKTSLQTYVALKNNEQHKEAANLTLADIAAYYILLRKDDLMYEDTLDEMVLEIDPDFDIHFIHEVEFQNESLPRTKSINERGIFSIDHSKDTFEDEPYEEEDSLNDIDDYVEEQMEKMPEDANENQWRYNAKIDFYAKKAHKEYINQIKNENEEARASLGKNKNFNFDKDLLQSIKEQLGETNKNLQVLQEKKQLRTYIDDHEKIYATKNYDKDTEKFEVAKKFDMYLSLKDKVEGRKFLDIISHPWDSLMDWFKLGSYKKEIKKQYGINDLALKNIECLVKNEDVLDDFALLKADGSIVYTTPLENEIQAAQQRVNRETLSNKGIELGDNDMSIEDKTRNLQRDLGSITNMNGPKPKTNSLIDDDDVSLQVEHKNDLNSTF